MHGNGKFTCILIELHGKIGGFLVERMTPVQPAAAYSVFLPFKLGTIWFYSGLAIFLLGLIFTVFTTVNFVAAPLNQPITRGLYRYSRHPMYVSILLIYLSVGLSSASWIFWLVSATWLVIMCFAAVDEERYCLKKYGNTYREYMDRTPRWLGVPRVRKND